MRTESEIEQEWDECPESCFIELLQAKQPLKRDLICIQIFAHAQAGTQEKYLAELKQEFVDWKVNASRG